MAVANGLSQAKQYLPCCCGQAVFFLTDAMLNARQRTPKGASTGDLVREPAECGSNSFRTWRAILQLVAPPKFMIQVHTSYILDLIQI